ncbi:MAG: rod shape-determining protein MreC [Clostridia bacterium]|nr:rod shape-determining protein MreC [Clostridia bacterium]
MARDREHQFSESENLQGLDKDWLLPDEDDQRLPAWAQRMAEDQNASHAEEKGQPSPEPRQGREQAEESGNSASAAPESKKLAEEAWDREAKKVESSQSRPAQPEDEAGQDGPGQPRKKPKKTNAKKKSRKKKRVSEAEERRGFVRSIVTVGLCVFLFVLVALMVVSNFVNASILNTPRRWVTSIVTPVQDIFSRVTESVAGYLRTLKIRGNIEYEYEQLTLLLDDYANLVAQNEELRRTNESLYDLLDEQNRNRSMNPVAATVIGTDSSNFFSTLDLDVGRANGVEDYMAVVAQGGLVGVTYDVSEYACKVRCIINSDCTVAALVQSSRDQGSVKGTLGINGEAMCRMYYLPDNSLPRPGDTVVTSGVGLEFPKGIPIGYIRESTRGMEDNKSYVVLEPVVDFQHLEYVTVYRYKPTYAEAAQQRDTTSASLMLEPLATPQPIPTWQVGGLSDFLFGPTNTPTGTETKETPTPSPAPTATPRVTATPDPNATAMPENLEYVQAEDADHTPTPSPRPTFTPTPSPVPTPDPGDMTVEDDA